MFDWFKPKPSAAPVAAQPSNAAAGGWLLGLAEAAVGVVAGILSEDAEKGEPRHAQGRFDPLAFDALTFDPHSFDPMTSDPQVLETYDYMTGADPRW